MSDDSFGVPTQRLRVAIDEDRLEFFRVEHADVFQTVGAYFGGMTVGYSHRGAGRHPIPHPHRPRQG